MDNSGVLRIQLPKTILLEAEKKALSAGFSSFKEVVESFVKQFAKGMSWENESYLTSRAYRKSIQEAREDVKKGRVYSREQVIKMLHLGI